MPTIERIQLKRTDLDKLNFDNNYTDSLALYFYQDRLFSIDISASDNRRVEYLKFAIKDKRESSLGRGGNVANDTTSGYGKYCELLYWSKDGPLRYEYREDIIKNLAVLTITNEKMLKMLPEPKTIH